MYRTLMGLNISYSNIYIQGAGLNILSLGRKQLMMVFSIIILYCTANECVPSGKRQTLMCPSLTSTNDRHNSCRTVIILAKQMMIQLSSSRRLIYMRCPTLSRYCQGCPFFHYSKPQNNSVPFLSRLQIVNLKFK